MGVYQKKRNDGTKARYYDFMHNKSDTEPQGVPQRLKRRRALDKKRADVLSGNFEIDTRVRNPKIEAFAEIFQSADNT